MSEQVESCSEDGRGVTSTCADQYTTADYAAAEKDQVYRFLLACKPELAGDLDDQSDTDEEQHHYRHHHHQQQQQQQMHPQPTTTYALAPSVSSFEPSKNSADYRHEVLEPRGIKIIDRSCDPNAATKLQLPPQFVLAAALNGALVTLNSTKLVKACQFAKGEYSEAQWTAEVYQIYFLLTNPAPEQSGVRRMVQHSFYWSGSSSNVCLPPIQDLDRRASGLREYSKVWFVANDKKGRQDISCWPDHCYFVLPEPAAYQAKLGNYANLPAFRGGLSHNDRIISCPPYFLTEEKPSVDLEIEARQYLAFVASFLLQERLLLRHLTDKAQHESEILFDESLCVYAMTNCGPLSTLYKMIVRNECAKTELSATKKKPVRFDLVKLCIFDLTVEAHCDQLRLWINYIHYWGMTVHMPAAMAEGAEASQSEYYINSAWQESLARKAFYYRATGIAFTTLKHNYLEFPDSLIPLKREEVLDRSPAEDSNPPTAEEKSASERRSSNTALQNTSTTKRQQPNRSALTPLSRSTSPRLRQLRTRGAPRKNLSTDGVWR